jgi:hypothetical protein
MDSEERPFSMHNPEERLCEFCNEIFYADHGLQRYCPEKYGKKNYCKYEQKKMLSEKRLAERVTELAKTGMKVNQNIALDNNKQGFEIMMGSDGQKIVNSSLLDNFDFDINYFDYRTPINGTNKFLIHIGEFTLEWIGEDGTNLIFKITRK